MASKTPRGADARLDDLEVREVSIVDRPANKKKFLVVKNEDGLSITEMEDDMPTKKEATSDMADVLNKSEAGDSLLDVLGIGISDQDDGDEGDVDETEEHEFVIVEKKVKDVVLKACSAALEGLTNEVNVLKKLEADDDVPDGCKANINKVIKTLTGLLAAEAVDKAVKAGAALKVCSACMKRLMTLIEKAKEMEDSVEKLPPPMVTEINGIATDLASLTKEVEQQKTEDDKDKTNKGESEETSDQGEDEDLIFKGEGEDPVIIIKAGAKMSRTRLSKLREAFKHIHDILMEIDPEHAEKFAKPKPEDKGKKKPTKKSEETQTIDHDAALKPITEAIDKLAGKMKALASKLDTSVEDVTKRVADLEGVTPAASDDDPPEEVKKKVGGLFHNVVGPIVRGR